MITPWEFDTNTLLALNFDGGETMDAVMWFVSGKFSWVWLYVAVFAWSVWKFGWKIGMLVLVAMAMIILCADQTSNLFKTFVPKLRPSHNEEIEGLVHIVNGYRGGLYGTVSAHAANSIGFAIFSSLLIRKTWYGVAMGIWVVAVCYSRIYLGVHYPCDIAFGLIEGTLWAIVWWKIFVLVKNRLDKNNFDKNKSLQLS